MNAPGHYSRNGFLTSRGYRDVAQRSLEGLEVDAMGPSQYVDRVGSVSALVEVEDDFDYAEDHVELNRRFIHNGS